MPNMKKPTGKVKMTPAQVAAKLAAEKKALDAYRKSRPSKDQVAKVRQRQEAEATANQKIVDRINAQTRANAQRTNRSKTATPKPTVKPKPLTGPAAIAEIQRRTSPAGVKKAEMDAKKATNKKYPGLYKK
jgi:hypothetical protein